MIKNRLTKDVDLKDICKLFQQGLAEDPLNIPTDFNVTLNSTNLNEIFITASPKEQCLLSLKQGKRLKI